ncbi:MAG TPA: energy transducer TonB [Longimicrobiales bacterium]
MERMVGAQGRTVRPLFEFLAASRPERAGRSNALASGVSVAGHALVLTLLGWTTMHAGPAYEGDPQLAHEYAVDLLPPAALARDAAVSPGAATMTTRHAVEAKHARYHDPGSELVSRARRELASLQPPAIELEVLPPPVAVFASLERSEYGGMGADSAFSAAEILADHHDKSAEDLASAAPQFTPYTEPPELSNPDLVRRQLSREYPMFLQDSGIGGRVILWFLVDETGKVRKWLLKQSSGHKALDQAALKVAHLMRFRPATNFDRHVSVWVALPVFFTVNEIG